MERYIEEIEWLNKNKQRGQKNRCNNFCKAVCFCFKSQKINDFENYENELSDAYYKVVKDSPKHWLKLFGVIEAGYWLLKVTFVNICCIPCFWYPKRSKVSPQDNNQKNHPIIDDCLCCCCAEQPPKGKKPEKEIDEEDFPCCCSFQQPQTSEQITTQTSKSTIEEATKEETTKEEATKEETTKKEATKEETTKTEATKEEATKIKSDQKGATKKEDPDGEFYKECKKLLCNYHEKSWNRIANRLNVCWAITSLFFLVAIIVASFVLWFGKVLK